MQSKKKQTPKKPAETQTKERQPGITREQAGALAATFKFIPSFNLHRRLTRALQRPSRKFPALEEIAQHASDLCDIEARVSTAADAFDTAAIDGALLAAIIAAAQTKHGALDQLALRRVARQLRSVQKAASGLSPKLVRLRDDAEMAKTRIKKARGSPRQPARRLVQELIPIWGDGTGKEVGYSRDPDSGEYRGPFLEFAENVNKLAGLCIATSALGPALDHLLRPRPQR